MVGILIVGDEILTADIQESNLHNMLQIFSRMGYDVKEVRIVRDVVSEIADALSILHKRCEFVFSTGGIGPTHDDVTMEAVAQAFCVSLLPHPEMLAFLTERYGMPLSPMVAKMALFPKDTRILKQKGNSWPIICKENVFILPGLPHAMLQKLQYLETILPHKNKRWTAELFLNADESIFADWLNEEQQQLPEVTIGSYPISDAEDYVARITIKGCSKEAVAYAVKRIQSYTAQQDWLVTTRGLA